MSFLDRRIRPSRASWLVVIAIVVGIGLSPGAAEGWVDPLMGPTAVTQVNDLSVDAIAKVTGGGNVLAAPLYPTSLASFGLNAKRPVGFTGGGTATGRINYDRHRNSTGRHVNVPVVAMEAFTTVTPPNGTGGKAAVAGDCSVLGSTCPPGSSSVVVYVEDNSDSGAGSDVFKIFFCSGGPILPPPSFTGGPLSGCDGPEGGTLRTGNIQIRADPGVTGEEIFSAAAAGVFTATPNFNGVELAGGIYGIGIRRASDSAYGDLHVEYTGISTIGLYQIISVDAWITSATNVAGTVTLSGTCTLDMGDGPPPVGGLSFTATLTGTGLSVTVNGTSIPALPKTDGFTVIE
jgi:hypothetical protein